MKQNTFVNKSIILFGAALLCESSFPKGLFGVDEAYTAVLTAVGLPPEKVEALKGVTAETLKDFKADDFVTTIRTGLETTFLNDPAFLSKLTKEKVPEALRKDIESGQYGRFMNEFKDYATKTLGLDLSDLTPEEEKSLKKVAEKVTGKYAGKLGSPEAIRTLQSDLQKALGDNTAMKQTHQQELEKAVGSERSKTGDLLTKLITQTEMAKIEGGLVVDPSLLVDAVIVKARELYTVLLDGTNIVLKRKDNPQLDVTNSDGTKKTYFQALGEIANELKIVKPVLEKKKEGEGQTTVEVQGGEVKLPAHIANKVNANLKAEGSAK
jgi:hypothetical protein